MSLVLLSDAKLARLFEEEAKQSNIQEETVDEIRRRVRKDSPRGFEWFYLLVRNMPLPRHGKKWVRRLYAVRRKMQLENVFIHIAKLINEAFRGSTKTTIFTETFIAYQIGLYPERSNLIVQASDDTAEEAASNIADTIMFNPGFRLLFPNVVPDERKGWGQKAGRWVWNKEFPYDDWVRLRHKNPTLLAGTYKGAGVVGKHPTGVFAIDDINDRKNTESERLNNEVNENLTDTLFPMLEGTRWQIFNQTPWTKRDALALIKDTGEWAHIHTPVMTVNPEGEGEHLVIHKDGQIIYENWVTPTWPEKFNVDMIASKYKESGEKGFARMYMLDLTAIEGLHLRREWLHDISRDEVPRNLPVYMGVDYASSADMSVTGDPNNSALAIVMKMGNGDRIIWDGWYGQVSQAEAEIQVNRWAVANDYLELIGIETDGTGRELYSLVSRNTDLPLLEMGTGGRSKPYRFEEVMAPYFEMGRVWIAHPFTPFIHKFIDEWISWQSQKGDASDTLDAVFYALGASGLFLEEFMVSSVRQRNRPWYEAEPEAVSPWGGFGRQARGRTHG